MSFWQKSRAFLGGCWAYLLVVGGWVLFFLAGLAFLDLIYFDALRFVERGHSSAFAWEATQSFARQIDIALTYPGAQDTAEPEPMDTQLPWGAPPGIQHP